MEKFKVTIPIPKPVTYTIEADYPEAAKREAAKRHSTLLPRLSRAEIVLIAHCFRANPKSSGRSYKEPTLIEELYKKYCG